MKKTPTPDDVRYMELYAWVGEDEYGSGEYGLKQAVSPAGIIPLVACKEGKIDQNYIKEQLQHQANVYGKPMRLCRFVFVQEMGIIYPEPEHEYAPRADGSRKEAVSGDGA